MTAVMAYLSTAYPKQALSAETVAVYADFLGGYPYAVVMDTAKEHVRSSPYWPAISELIPPPAPKPQRQGISPPRATEYPASAYLVGWPRAIRKQLEKIGKGGTYTPPTIEDARREQGDDE